MDTNAILYTVIIKGVKWYGDTHNFELQEVGRNLLTSDVYVCVGGGWKLCIPFVQKSIHMH